MEDWRDTSDDHLYVVRADGTMLFDDLGAEDQRAAEQRQSARIRAYRASDQYQADSMMARTRAAVCLVNTQINGGRGSRLEAAAFLAIFHPEMSDDRKREVMRGMELR